MAVCGDHDLIPPGAWSWTPIDAFNDAEYLEVFLDGEPPQCEVADYCILILDAPSDVARADVPTEEEMSAQLAEEETHRESRTLLDRLKRLLFGN